MASSSSASDMYDELQELEDECAQALNETRVVTAHPTGLYCEGMFDGWSCWNDTPAGHVANQSCPTFVTGFEPDRFSYKKCNDDGTWFRLQATNKTWTNYSTCVNMEDLMWQQQVTSVYKAGYSISLVALVLSLVLLSYFRSLRCARIIIHMNLFASFAINNALWLLWYAVLVNPVMLHENWGLSVTVLFCFCNGEVISQVKRKWKNLMFRPRANSCTATTVSYVAGEEKICLHKTANKKQLQRTLSSQRHQLQATNGSTDKVNV